MNVLCLFCLMSTKWEKKGWLLTFVWFSSFTDGESKRSRAKFSSDYSVIVHRVLPCSVGKVFSRMEPLTTTSDDAEDMEILVVIIYTEAIKEFSVLDVKIFWLFLTLLYSARLFGTKVLPNLWSLEYFQKWVNKMIR